MRKYEEFKRERDEAMLDPRRRLVPGDLTECAATNASQDRGELGLVLAVRASDEGDMVYVATQSKRCGFHLGWAFVYPWLMKA